MGASEQQGRVWEGHRSITYLLPPRGSETRRMSVSIRVEQYAETPPPIFKDRPEPTDGGFFRSYCVADDSDWLSCVVGHVRVHIQYEIQGVSRAYHPLGWEPPAPLLPDELQRRLALVQRIIHSFDWLAPG